MTIILVACDEKGGFAAINDLMVSTRAENPRQMEGSPIQYMFEDGNYSRIRRLSQKSIIHENHLLLMAGSAGAAHILSNKLSRRTDDNHETLHSFLSAQIEATDLSYILSSHEQGTIRVTGFRCRKFQTGHVTLLAAGLGADMFEDYSAFLNNHTHRSEQRAVGVAVQFLGLSIRSELVSRDFADYAYGGGYELTRFDKISSFTKIPIDLDYCLYLRKSEELLLTKRLSSRYTGNQMHLLSLQLEKKPLNDSRVYVGDQFSVRGLLDIEDPEAVDRGIFFDPGIDVRSLVYMVDAEKPADLHFGFMGIEKLFGFSFEGNSPRIIKLGAYESVVARIRDTWG